MENDVAVHGAWLNKLAREHGRDPLEIVDEMAAWLHRYPDAAAVAQAYPLPEAYLQGYPFLAPGFYCQDRSGSRSPRAQRPAGTADEIRPIIDAARAQDRVFSSQLLELVGAQGGEHAVVLSPVRVLKFTDPDSPYPYGSKWVWSEERGEPAIAPAWPDEYLRRLDLSRDKLGDDQRLEGVIERAGKCALVTSQSAAFGDAPSDDDLRRMLANSGFRQIGAEQEPKQWYNAEQNLIIMDAKPDNFAENSDGEIGAIDVQPIIPEGAFKEWAIKHSQGP